MGLRLVTAPPLSAGKAINALNDELDWVFDAAHELTGCHAPYEMEAERLAVASLKKLVKKALLALPKEQLVELGRKAHEIAEAREIEIDQLRADYEKEHE